LQFWDVVECAITDGTETMICIVTKSGIPFFRERRNLFYQKFIWGYLDGNRPNNTTLNN